MEMKKTAALAAICLFAVLSASLFADSSPGATPGKGAAKGIFLQARATRLSCRIDQATSLLDDIVAKVPPAADALSQPSTALKNDKSQLSTLASAGDPSAFNSFVSGALKADTQSAVKAVGDVLKDFKGYNVSKEDRASLRDDRKSFKGTAQQCEQGAAVQIGQARLEQYNDYISKWQATATKLGQKGVGTSGMQSVIDGAKSSIIAPLQSAISSGDANQTAAALRTYCIGNGCGGTNGQEYDYHGFAKFDLARLQAMVAKLQSGNTSGTGLDAVSQELSIVQSTLSTVGTAKYTPDQSKAVWGGLKQAAGDLKSYLQQANRKGNPAASGGSGQ